MKKVMMILAAVLMTVSAVSAEGQKDGGAEKVTMKMQHNLTTNDAWHLGFEYIKDEMVEAYPELDATIYPNGQLAKGDWKIIFEQTQGNIVQMTCESQVTLATLVPELFALSTPFMFEDMDHVLRFMDEDPAFVNDWFSKLEEKNLKVITYWPRAPRQLLNSKRPIITPDDINGLKFRVPGMDLFITTFESIGAKPVPMSYGEVYTAMQLGTIVGEDNALQTVFNSKNYEQGKYFNEWNYMADGVLVVVNKDWYDGLPSDFQTKLTAVAKESTQVVLEEVKKQEAIARDGMTDFGIEITQFTAEMKEPWKAMMGPVYAEVEELIGEEAWKELQATADLTR